MSLKVSLISSKKVCYSIPFLVKKAQISNCTQKRTPEYEFCKIWQVTDIWRKVDKTLTVFSMTEIWHGSYGIYLCNLVYLKIGRSEQNIKF